jgi:hypothetical protein
MESAAQRYLHLGATLRLLRCCLQQVGFMRSLPVSPYLRALVLLAAFALSCGGNSSSDRVLQSITLSPATADARDYPGGQVQFTATGFYTANPRTVTPLAAGWGSCFQNAPTSDVTVSSAGMAQCISGAAGTYTVFADDASGSVACNAITACGGGCQVSGNAQLTCP